MVIGILGPFVFAFGLLLNIWRSYIATILWDWFIIPVFSAPSLSIWQFWGIMLLWQLMRPSELSYKSTEKAIYAILDAIVNPIILLLIGYLIKSWML